MRTAILCTILLIHVSYTYSQFYDVKIVPKVKVVGTRGKPATPLNVKNIKTTKNADSCPEKMDTNVLCAHPDSTINLTDKDSIRLHADERLFCAPLETLVVSSGYGYRKDPFTGKRKFHAGTDYVTHSENVYAMMPGRIRKIGYDKRLGNFITLDHGDIRVTYAHLHTVVGRKGDNIFAGQSIGISGNTGRSTGEHLHVSMRYKKEVVDPDPLIKVIRDYATRYLREQQLLSHRDNEVLKNGPKEKGLPVSGMVE